MLRDLFFSALVVLLCSSCLTPSEEPIPSDPAKIPVPREVKEESYIDLGEGLKYYDFKVGTGEPVKDGDILSVHYHGWLTDSTLFDSSYPREEPFLFRLGIGAVIPGWERGIAGMSLDGERQLVVPPDLAYGSQGRGTIPPNATLIFEVILISVN